MPFPAVVEAVNGEWLWLGEAWLCKSDVMSSQQTLMFYTEQLRSDPASATNWRCRAAAWESQHRLQCAINDYNEAIRLNPQSAVSFNSRGSAWQQKGEYDKAISDFSEAIRLYPSYARAYNNRAVSWYSKGEYDKSFSDFSEAIWLNPLNSSFHSNSAEVLLAIGEYADALDAEAEALRLDPKNWDAIRGVAYIRATCPIEEYRDGAKARTDAEEACRITGWKEWQCLGTLAAAYAETGDFDNAVRWAKKSVRAATMADGRRKLCDQLAFYCKKQPFGKAAVDQRAQVRILAGAI